MYRLCNVSGSESASYTARMSHEVSDNKTSLKDAMASVQVRVEPPNTTYSGAGIMFRKSRDKPEYLSYMLQAGNAVSLLLRGETSLSVKWSHDLTGSEKNGFVKLRIKAKGPRLDLYADNNHIYPPSENQKVDLLEGDPGIFAYGTGCFVFKDFEIYERVRGTGCK